MCEAGGTATTRLQAPEALGGGACQQGAWALSLKCAVGVPLELDRHRGTREAQLGLGRRVHGERALPQGKDLGMGRSVHLSAWDAGCSHELSWARGPSSLPSVLAGVGEGRAVWGDMWAGVGRTPRASPGLESPLTFRAHPEPPLHRVPCSPLPTVGGGPGSPGRLSHTPTHTCTWAPGVHTHHSSGRACTREIT